METELLTVERTFPTPAGIFVTEPAFSVVDTKMDEPTLECVGSIQSPGKVIRNTKIVFNLGHINMGSHIPDEPTDLYSITIQLPDLNEHDVFAGTKIFVAEEVAAKFPNRWPQSKK